MRIVVCALSVIGSIVFVGCASDSETGVVDKVMQDFGLRERPEGYVSGEDNAYAQLPGIGRTEIQRLNNENRHGEVKFEEGDDGFGKFYKEVKVYEDFHPLDARASGRGPTNEQGGYVGIIEYSYRIHQSLRKNTRAEASAEPASVVTDFTDRETLRYRLDRSGAWGGSPGERVAN